MRSVLKTIAFVAVAAFAGLAWATLPEAGLGQYQAIPDRNVFGLRPPAAQPTLTNPPAPVPKIMLTGITTILGNKRALMKVLPVGLKPGEANKEQSLILTEGQREGEVEVLQIDERAGSVKVNNSGTVMTLTFEKDGAKLPTTPQPGTVPVAPSALPGVGVPNPTAQMMNARKTPSRNARWPGLGATTPNPTAVQPPAGGVPTPTGLPTVPGQNPSLADQQLSAEEQAIINAFQQQQNGGTGSVVLPNAPATQNGAAPPPVPALPVGTAVPGTRVLVPQ